MTEFAIDIGVSEADRDNITDGLSRLLADTYTLYLKTHSLTTPPSPREDRPDAPQSARLRPAQPHDGTRRRAKGHR